eukprot:1161469-Pelagomonas_calceolata.AAC.39
MFTDIPPQLLAPDGPSVPWEIVGLISVEGENIPYITPVETQGEMNGVERWLLKSEEIMRKSLASITKDAIEAFTNRPRERWILEWPGQVVIAVGQVGIANIVADCLKFGILKASCRALDPWRMQAIVTGVVNEEKREGWVGSWAWLSLLSSSDVLAEPLDDELSFVLDQFCDAWMPWKMEACLASWFPVLDSSVDTQCGRCTGPSL